MLSRMFGPYVFRLYVFVDADNMYAANINITLYFNILNVKKLNTCTFIGIFYLPYLTLSSVSNTHYTKIYYLHIVQNSYTCFKIFKDIHVCYV